MATVLQRRPAREPVSEVLFRPPRPTDGPEVNELIARCKPLDENSLYCNLLQTTHFASTSVAAEAENGLVGFISGYLLPARDDTLFIWQVAVADEARGLGLGKRMIRSILERPVMRGAVHYLNTTVTPDNDASWGLFRSFAREVEAPIATRVLFDGEEHFSGAHDDEVLIEIGPFDV